jgi:hypothetical protein
MGGTHETETENCCCFTVKCGACRSCCWPCFKPCSCGDDCVIDCCVICRGTCNVFQFCDEPPSWTYTCGKCGTKVSYYAIGEAESDRRCDEIAAEHRKHCAAQQQVQQARPMTVVPPPQVVQNPLHQFAWSCDGCGINAIEGSGMPRYRSTTREDYDLCRKCFTLGKLANNGPFEESST